MIAPADFRGLVRTRIKICGITRPEDARAAIESGADLLGFNLWSGSQRYLRLEASRSWIASLVPLAVRVAVMVNPTMDEVLRAMGTGCFEAVQLHGRETPEFCRELVGRGIRCLKALPVGTEVDPVPVARYGGTVILLDTQTQGRFGGTGLPVDVGVAAQIVAAHPGRRILLAGGLRPETVAEAIRTVRPFGVDVAGGVEIAPGIKSPDLIRRFCEAVRDANAPVAQRS